MVKLRQMLKIVETNVRDYQLQQHRLTLFLNDKILLRDLESSIFNLAFGDV